MCMSPYSTSFSHFACSTNLIGFRKLCLPFSVYPACSFSCVSQRKNHLNFGHRSGSMNTLGSGRAIVNAGVASWPGMPSASFLPEACVCVCVVCICVVCVRVCACLCVLCVCMCVCCVCACACVHVRSGVSHSLHLLESRGARGSAQF